MSLDLAIQSGKEKRRPYRGGKAVDCSCRNHGSCPWCRDNRTFFDRKARIRLEDQEDEFFCYWEQPDPSDVLDEIGHELYEIDKENAGQDFDFLIK